MKKTTKIFAVTCGALALFACKTDIEKTVNLTDVTDQKMHLENADLNVEISSCSNYEDSRQPSDSLLKVQNRVPQIFPAAKYQQCFKKKFKSYASFTLPVVVGNSDLGVAEGLKKGDGSGIGILSSTKEDKNLFVMTSKEFSKKIQRLVKKEMKYTDFDFNVILTVKNNTGEEQSFNIENAYFDGKPTPKHIVNLENGGSYKIKLSNVASDYLWNKNDAALVDILTEKAKENK